MFASVALAVALAAAEVPITTRSEEARRLFLLARDRQMELDGGMGVELDRPPVLKPLERALAFDPRFALAHAWFARFSSSKEALRHLDLAEELARGLGPAERLWIEEFAAERRGEEDKARRLLRALAELAPDDWRVRLRTGVRAGRDGDHAGALVHLQRAIELKPDVARSYNALAYAHAQRHDFPAAVAAVERYIALRPREANARDTLGDILLLAGGFAEAEKSFLLSAELDPSFWAAWLGVAQARFCQERWDEGRAAAVEAERAAPDRSARLQARLVAAFSLAAQGLGADALAELDRIERAAPESSWSRALAAVQRGELLLFLGRPDEASAQADAARDRAEPLRDPTQRRDVEVRSRLLQLHSAVARGTLGEAAHELADLEELLVTSPFNAVLKSWVHAARGDLLLARKKPAQALAELRQCGEDDSFCRILLARAQAAAGDRAGAEATRGALLSSATRDPVWRGASPGYLLARAEARRSRLTPAFGIFSSTGKGKR